MTQPFIGLAEEKYGAENGNWVRLDRGSKEGDVFVPLEYLLPAVDGRP